MELKYPRRTKRVIGGLEYTIEPPTNERSKIMSRIPSKRTSIENLLAAALKKNGVRFKRPKRMVGNPDFRILGKKIVVYCDGDFWHGYNIDKLSIKSNSEFWFAKINRNIQRDMEINDVLTKRGWTVIRFWEHDLRKNMDLCIERLKRTVYEKENV